ncbi:cytochrome c3 family protein [uncultured Desulfovibrio sp.]|uniref:cytochrome c3 family protein n=2 Tax=uncultured Desulfovibrio sp. TaxID=167968 RepID=UPI002617EC10|nr:cytochrome c3 family protein [uncultured Desulfovibrio sp.]
MKKFMFLAVILSLALALPVLAAQPPVPGTPLEFKGSRKTVMFPHAPHAKVECVTCHHLVQGKENFQKCATAGCHDDLTAKKGEKSLFYVVHAKTGLKQQTCLECHTKIVAEKPDLKKDLTGCAKSRCHP